MSTNKKFAHEMVAQIAKELAACFYEEAAHDDTFFHFYPSQKHFVNHSWKLFIEAAKTTLAVMLGKMETPEWQKELISDALIKHASLPGNVDKRVAAKVITGDQSQIMNEIKRVIH